MQQHQVLILDFGSQYTQLIARRVRELNIYCEIHPYNKQPANASSFKAVILSGSPSSVRSEGGGWWRSLLGWCRAACRERASVAGGHPWHTREASPLRRLVEVPDRLVSCC